VTSASDLLHYVQGIYMAVNGRQVNIFPNKCPVFSLNQLLSGALTFCMCGWHSMTAFRDFSFTDMAYTIGDYEDFHLHSY
jgi:hypothetical protein